MATIIKFDIKELRKLVNDKSSCVVEKKVTQNLALQPWCLGNLKESIKNMLDYKIGKFDKEFNGILLSYKNLRILQNVGTIRNDNADIYFQVQADYFIFRPYIGATLRGIVNKKSATHLGILIHRVFNVVVPRPTEEPGHKWFGESVQEGQHVTFRIAVLDLYGALPYIRGELDERSVNGDGDPDEEEFDCLDVSYVDFEKTKPQVLQKHIGDYSPELPNATSPLKSNGKCTSSPNVSRLKKASEGEVDQNKDITIKSKKLRRKDTDTSQEAKTKVEKKRRT